VRSHPSEDLHTFSSKDLLKIFRKKGFEKGFVKKLGENLSFQSLSKICINLGLGYGFLLMR
jgi:hypothetical protein